MREIWKRSRPVRFSRSVWERFLSSLSKQSRFPIFSASFRWTIEASQRVDNMHTGGPCQAVQTGIVRGHSKGLLIIRRCARLSLSQICAMAGHSMRSPDAPTARSAGQEGLEIAVQDWTGRQPRETEGGVPAKYLVHIDIIDLTGRHCYCSNPMFTSLLSALFSIRSWF